MRAVDLFAGCGGLSLGLEWAGFEPALAVERSPMAAETHFRNFHRRGLAWDDELWASHLARSPLDQGRNGGTVVGDILEIVADHSFIEYVRDEIQPTIVAGGPPCQGFSMAGRRDPKDLRNQLPWAFLNFVEAVGPRAVIIENVVGINRAFRQAGADAPFEQLRQALAKTGEGYYVQPVELNAKHFDIPQNRPRMMLLAVRRDIAETPEFPPMVAEPWSSQAEAKGQVQPSPSPLVPAVTSPTDFLTVRHALIDLDENGYTVPPEHESYRQRDWEFAASMRHDPKGDIRDTPLNHTHRRHTTRVLERFQLYGLLRDEGIPNSILGIPYDRPEAVARQELTDILDGRGKPDDLGAPDETLVDVVMRLRTKKHTQRAIAIDQPAPTVVTLPDDYVHPTQPRIMTVRELARFQSFPDWFEFRSKETTGSHRRKVEVPQFSQVGNAVPPLLGAQVASRIKAVLTAGEKAKTPAAA